MGHELGGIGHMAFYPMSCHVFGACDEEFDLERFAAVERSGKFASENFLVDVVHLPSTVLDNPWIGCYKKRVIEKLLVLAHNGELAQVRFETAVFRAYEIKRLIHEMVPKPGGHSGNVLEVLVKRCSRDSYFFANVNYAHFRGRGCLHEFVCGGNNLEPGFKLF